MDSVGDFVRDNPLVPTTAVALVLLSAFYRRLFPKAAPISSISVGSAKEGETAPRRSKKNREILSKPVDEVSTLYELLLRSSKKFADRNAVGWREIVDTITEEKEVITHRNGEDIKEMKKWNYWQLSSYKWMKYKDLYERVCTVGSGLVSKEIGLKPRESKIGIFCNTCPEWLTLAHACFQQSLVVVTVYANLGEEGLTHAINEGELTHLFCNAELLPMLQKVSKSCPSLKLVIYVDKPKSGDVEKVNSVNIKAFAFDELLKIGKANPAEHVPPKPDDLAIIMYTSGTTDLPKGVMMTHGNMVAALTGAFKSVELFPTDVYVAYLPLAHVLELIVENFILLCGLPMGYANPKTLSDSAVRNCYGDLHELRPTLMAGVPAVWERIRKGVMTKIEASGAIKRAVFKTAYAYKAWMIKGGASTPIVDKIVFSKFQDQVGGRLRAILSGGAPISRDSLEFLRCCFAIPVIQGYGLTECCGICNLMDISDPGFERVGPPVACTEIKLVDVPDMKYFATDKPYPRGEVWLRGPNVTLGYFKNEKKTNEDFKDGWFHTGDVGQWNADGTLSIIDRKKNLVKLSHGEYVALEKLESKYKGSKYVENVLVYGDSSKDHVVALVVPVKAELESWAKGAGVKGSWADICKSKEAKKFVLGELKSIGQKEGLKSYESVQGVHLCEEEWTPDNNLLTAAQKTKRQPIVEKYKKDIEALYK